MSTLIVSGSPREGMYSDRLADIMAKLSDTKVERLRSIQIGPCHACEYCHEINPGYCLQKDGMVNLYQKFKAADTICIFSPIYWWQVTAQTKLFIDRLYAMGKEDWEGKKIIVVLNGEAEDDDVEYDILKRAFEEMVPYMGARLFYLGVGTDSEEDFAKKAPKVEAFLKEAIEA